MDKKIRSTINARQIKAARALLDWSQEDLANTSGLSIATIRKIESGHISPRGKTINSIET
jgi:transcriptional regulator with XRE-family HTH domain